MKQKKKKKKNSIKGQFKIFKQSEQVPVSPPPPPPPPPPLLPSFLPGHGFGLIRILAPPVAADAFFCKMP